MVTPGSRWIAYFAQAGVCAGILGLVTACPTYAAIQDKTKQDAPRPSQVRTAVLATQAEKDLKTAEFYARTGHPTSAYFCYEVVRRRYPGTEQAKTATRRMDELKKIIKN